MKGGQESKKKNIAKESEIAYKVKMGHISQKKGSIGKVPDKMIRIKQDGKVFAQVPILGNTFYFFKKIAENANSVPTLYYKDIAPIIDFFGFHQKDLADFMHVDASTITRWKKNRTEIGVLRSKNILDIDEIIAKGVRIFGGESKFRDWLDSNNYALGDLKPVEMLKDPYGVEKVDEALEAISWGAYI